MPNVRGSNGEAKIQASGPKPERVYSSAEVAVSLDVSEMTLLRAAGSRRLPQRSFFVMQQGFRVWLWDADEFARACTLSSTEGQYLQCALLRFSQLSSLAGVVGQSETWIVPTRFECKLPRRPRTNCRMVASFVSRQMHDC